MKQAIQIASIYTMLFGLFLLIEGIWGLFSPIVFGFLTTNTLHASIHIILGITGIWVGAAEKPRTFCIFTGGLLLLVGVMRFIRGTDDIVVNLLRVNYAVAVVNIIAGTLSLIIAAIVRKHSPRTDTSFKTGHAGQHHPQ